MTSNLYYLALCFEDRKGDKDNLVVDQMYSGDVCMYGLLLVLILDTRSQKPFWAFKCFLLTPKKCFVFPDPKSQCVISKM